MQPILDPRDGDIECDASSAKKRSILALAGSLLAEISLPKLVLAWFVLVGFPALLLGAMPIAASIWLETVWLKLDSAFQGIIPAVALLVVAGVGVLAGRRLFRIAERSFWSLNSLAVQPVYAICRELLSQIGDRVLLEHAPQNRRAVWRAVTAGIAGLTICLCSTAVLLLAFPHTVIVADFASLGAPLSLVKGAVANSIAIVSSYVAAGSIVWAFADATMPPTRDYDKFKEVTPSSKRWRIAHLSDIHTVGERFGFRIESGRSGPRGNDRLVRAFAELDTIHGREPLDAILVTGDITDAGLASEWAEFMTALESFPRLSALTLLIPGNHDLNVVSRANPAQFDFPTSPYKKLRKIRTLSALHAAQGARVHVIDRRTAQIGVTLAQALTPHVEALSAFAKNGKPRSPPGFDDLWAGVFPMILPPSRADGLGIALMNSNADSHFSFTNALGMVTTDEVAALEAALGQYPEACWVVCLHHHMIEYPRRADALSERIGTALINGQWLVRRLQKNGAKMIVMHGHRHIDWFGVCGSVPIFSAPSTIMGDDRGQPPRFYVHTIQITPQGQLELLTPQAIALDCDTAAPVELRGSD